MKVSEAACFLLKLHLSGWVSSAAAAPIRRDGVTLAPLGEEADKTYVNYQGAQFWEASERMFLSSGQLSR